MDGSRLLKVAVCPWPSGRWTNFWLNFGCDGPIGLVVTTSRRYSWLVTELTGCYTKLFLRVDPCESFVLLLLTFVVKFEREGPLSLFRIEELRVCKYMKGHLL